MKTTMLDPKTVLFYIETERLFPISCIIAQLVYGSKIFCPIIILSGSPIAFNWHIALTIFVV